MRPTSIHSLLRILVPLLLFESSSGLLALQVPGSEGPPVQSSVVVRVKDLGAVGDGVADDTAAFQAAIDKVAAAGGEILVTPGNYKINKTLHWTNPKNAKAPGIWLVGAGYTNTHLLSYVRSGPLFEIRGVPAKGSVNTTFFWGGGIEGIDFVGTNAGTSDHDALDILGWYWGHIRNCRFTGFSRNGITSRVDLTINANPDYTSSSMFIEGTLFERLGGRGYDGAFIGNPAWKWDHCLFNLCAQGAARILSARHTFDSCSFAGSGYESEGKVVPGDHPHLEIGQLRGSISQITIQNCEFDFAKSAHLFINSLEGGDIHDNRFIFRSWGSQDVTPQAAIVLAPAGADAAVQGLNFNRNVFRVDGRTGGVALYIWQNTSNVQNITVQGSIVSDQSAGRIQITRYKGYDKNGINTRRNYVISDDNQGWISKGKWPSPMAP